MNKLRFYVGSYTNFDILAHLPNNKKTGEGIYCFDFNEGEIEYKYLIPAENPAVLSYHPLNKDLVYSLTEGIIDNGLIQGYNIKDNNNKLIIHEFTSWHSKGKSTCYLKIDPITYQYAISINYWEGSLDLFKLNKNGKLLNHINHINHNNLTLYNKNERRQVKNREDHWVNRQVGAHAHSIHYWGNKVYIPDLGENSIFQYNFNPVEENEKNVLQYEKQIKLKPGCGPRHMVFSKKWNCAYVSNELNSSVCVLELVNNSMKVIQYENTYNKDKIKNIKNYVSEIAISKDERFIYISNRGVDIISIFKIIQSGKLKYINSISTYGKTPRHFVITPDNKYIISANQDSNSLVVFKRNIENGMLSLFKIYENPKFNAPNYILL